MNSLELTLSPSLPHLHSLDTLVRGDLLKRVLCHWEPSVRHLAHMLIIYRFFEPMRMVLQASFLQALVYQLEESAHKEPNFVPLSDQIFEDKRVDPKLNDMQKSVSVV